MSLELYYYNECPFCQKVLNTITNLKIQDKITMKNIREHQEYQKELITMNGTSQVPCLKIDGKPMLESSEISSYLVSQFM